VLEWRIGDALDRLAAEHGVARARRHALRAGIDDRVRRIRERARGVDDVVDDHGLLAANVTDDVHDLGDVWRGTPLVDDRETGAEALRECAGALDATGIGRHHDRLVAAEAEHAELLDQHGHRVEVVERDVEEALDLAGVEIHRERAIGAGGGDEVRDQLRRDRRAGLRLAVLPRVPEVRDDRDDAAGAGTLERVDRDQELHQRFVGWRTRRLNHEAVHTADVLADLYVNLAIREVRDLRAAKRNLDELTNFVCEGSVGITREDR